MAFSKIILNGVTLMDVTQDTVTAPTLKQGETAHGADGEQVVGTMSGGGGGGGTGDVVFIDYDGTVITSKTKAEITAMTSDSDLPDNPSHAGLVAQGWNWTVAQLKAQLTATPNQKVYVGQMYITESGNTEIDVSMPECRLDPIMTIAVNGTITIDWGDNTTPDTVTGSSLTTRLTPSHTYASAGDYTISIHAESGNKYSFYCSSSYLLLRKNTTQNESKVYANCIQKVRLGSGITQIYNYVFYYCTSLTSITIPNSVTSIGTNAFYSCYSLTSIVIPKDITSIGNSTFSSCYSLTSIAISEDVTSIGNSAFYGCYSLINATIPSSVTSIGTYAFYSCASLKSITIPSGITSIETYAFSSCVSFTSIAILDNVTSIESNAFNGCYSLVSITIPADVTSIGTSVFSNCYGLKELHMLPTTPPTLGNAITNISSDMIIYVPKGTLSTYQGETNWSAHASIMQEES